MLLRIVIPLQENTSRFFLYGAGAMMIGGDVEENVDIQVLKCEMFFQGHKNVYENDVGNSTKMSIQV